MAATLFAPLIRVCHSLLKIVMYTVFGDESSDETHQRSYAVAGLFGDDLQWKELEQNWLARTGGKIFHAKDCDSDAGDYADTPHRENKKLYRDLTHIIARSNLLGAGVAVDLKQYKAIFPHFLEEQPHFLCFQDVLVAFAEIAHLSIPQDKVKFSFDRNHRHEYNAAYMYDILRNMPEWQFHANLADELSFVTRESPCIQAADLVARETMKHLDNQVGPVVRRTRGSLGALADTRRFRFKYYGTRHLEGMRDEARQLEAPGAKMSAYLTWLGRMRLDDNMSNRFRYLAFIQNEIRKSKMES